MADKRTVLVKAKNLHHTLNYTIVPTRHPLNVVDHGPDYRGDVTYERAPDVGAIVVGREPTEVEVFDDRHLELLKSEPNIEFCDESEKVNAHVDAVLKEEDKPEEPKKLFGKKK